MTLRDQFKNTLSYRLASYTENKQELLDAIMKAFPGENPLSDENAPMYQLIVGNLTHYSVFQQQASAPNNPEGYHDVCVAILHALFHNKNFEKNDDIVSFLNCAITTSPNTEQNSDELMGEAAYTE